ncbi:MAG: hypothetical protein PHG06_06660 [Parabacteroides sp.]|jgi:hypothetical protein|nr:hypothetical protein [Parabacteroides sp.]
MKTSKFLVGVVLILIFFYSCDSNQRDVQELIDPWLRERTPIAFKVEGQVGEAVIVNNWRKDEDGSINVTLISSAINDLRNVQVLSLELQYNATSSLGVGGTLDLSDGSDSFVVEAENGETRTYVVTFDEFYEPIVGDYAVEQLWLYGGTGPEYGGGAVWPMMEKSWRWNVDGKPTAEEDNIISLVLKGVNEETGDTYGTCYNDAGPDGMYASFIYDDRNWVKHDLKHFYRCIPEGEGEWEKNSQTGVITFISKEGVRRSCTLLTAGTHAFDQYKSITIEKLAFNFPVTEGVEDNWDVIWQDDAKYLHHPRNFVVKMEKL